MDALKKALTEGSEENEDRIPGTQTLPALRFLL
jgi:hypothetical protein